MSFNLKTISAVDTSTFQLKSADDELLVSDDGSGITLPVTVTVFGPGSKEYQRSQHKAQTRVIERLKKRGKAEPTLEEKRRDTAEQLADLTQTFANLDYEGLTGRELAVAIYSDPSIGFIADQVNKHAGDWANFTKGSQAT